MKLLCASDVIAQLKFINLATSFTVQCLASCPLPLQAALAELHSLLLPLSLLLVLEAVLYRLLILVHLMEATVMRFAFLPRTSAGISPQRNTQRNGFAQQAVEDAIQARALDALGLSQRS